MISVEVNVVEENDEKYVKDGNLENIGVKFENRNKMDGKVDKN
jgi:hypothetical protein